MCKNCSFMKWCWFFILWIITFVVMLSLSITFLAYRGVAANVVQQEVLPDGITTRFFMSADLVDGRVSNIFINDSLVEREVNIDFNNIKVSCDFLPETDVCDVNIHYDWTPSCFANTGLSMCMDNANCLIKNMCYNHRIYDEPTCSMPFRNTQVCVSLTYKLANCFTLRYINPSECKITGSLDITQNSNTTSFSIDTINMHTNKNDIGVFISNVQHRFPFSDKILTTTGDILGSVAKVVESSELCVFNNGIGCLAPVYKDNGVNHIIQNPIERVDWRNTRLDATNKKDFAYLGLNNNKHLLNHLLAKTNTLSDILGEYTHKTDSHSITFESHKKASILFYIDLIGIYDREEVPICEIVSAEVDCEGYSEQEYMHCILKLVTGHSIGSSITLKWENDEDSFECITQTRPLPAIPREEGEITFTLTSAGAIVYTGTTIPVISHPSPTEDQDPPIIIGTDGDEIPPYKPIIRNNTADVVLVILIVCSSVLIVFGILGLLFVAYYYKRWCWYRTKKKGKGKFEMVNTQEPKQNVKDIELNYL